ncbi:MAG: 3-hydroxyacyl-CoA dehydrogenase family protein, partial [Alphaproteobacteria bacterium]|nr:3-hydroxyacyl-CoA dehydrogenase family protein [Alphaproteobacteria bacterium]
PFAMIDLWEEHGGSKPSMMKGEAETVAELITGEVAQNLIRVFLLREQLKKTAGNASQEIKRVHVIGAGTMGGDIAAWCAYKGLTVSVTDQDPEQIGNAIGRATELFEKKLKDSASVRDAHDRLTPDMEGTGLRRADLVIEAVAEKLDVKVKVFEQMEAEAPEQAVLATNTSSIPLEDIADGLEHPERLIGLHFFNPVAQLPLVEVVGARGSSDAARATGAAFVEKISKLPLPVRSAPGFFVNRVLTPYLLEAMRMLEEGIKAETIDKAAEDFGMPMGPVELADSIGLDIALDVGKRLAEDTQLSAPESLEQMVDDGKLGRKSGEGFYKWKDGKAEKNAAGETDLNMIDRLILSSINACGTCLRNKVVEDEDMADAGMIFGAGFAPFRGGPVHYAKKIGFKELTERLSELAESHGAPFEPDAYWSERAHEASSG